MTYCRISLIGSIPNVTWFRHCLLPFASHICLCEADYQKCCNINVEPIVDGASDSEEEYNWVCSASNCHTPHGHKVMFTNSPINVMFSQVLQVIYINSKLTWILLHTFTTVWDETFIKIREYGGRGCNIPTLGNLPVYTVLAFITLWWIKLIKLKQICPITD